MDFEKKKNFAISVVNNNTRKGQNMYKDMYQEYYDGHGETADITTVLRTFG